MSTVTERVAAGAAFLDEHDPEWWRADAERAIDLEALDLMNANKCVLGQRCPLEAPYARFYIYAGTLSGIGAPDYADGDFDEYEEAEYLINLWAMPLGFQAQHHNPGDDYDALTAEWKRVITERRAAS